jgi:hypothetical protein
MEFFRDGQYAALKVNSRPFLSYLRYAFGIKTIIIGKVNAQYLLTIYLIPIS